MSFDLTTPKSNLVASLAKAVSWIPNSASGRTSVVYLKPQDGKLRVAVSYPDVTFSTLCCAEGDGTEDVVALYGQKFYNIVKQASGDVQLLFEGAEFVVRCSGAKWVERPIRGSLQELDPPDVAEAVVKASTLAEAFTTISYVASKDTLVPSLFAVDVQDGRVRASNGANYHEIRCKIPGLTFQVSNTHVESFTKLMRLWTGEVHFSQNESNYYFRHEDDVLILRKLNVTFPDLDRLLIRPLKVQAQFLLKVRKLDMEEVLRKVRVSSSPAFPYVELHMHSGEVVARCLGDDGVQAVGKIEAIWNTAPRIATFNTNQLYSIVTHQDNEILEIRLAKDTKDRKSPIIMEGEDSWSLLTQLRMKPRG